MTDFTYIRTAVKGEKETFAVSVHNPDGTSTYVGTVIHFWIRHMEMMGWEARARDGHRAVHKERRQAALALIWDGKGYPFPMSRA
jgi:hypothetical protein